MTGERQPRRSGACHVLMLASGLAAMGYEIVWTQQSALWLGHESAAVLAVVAALFGGLAVGGLVLGARIEASARPVRWYAGCELVVALWGVVLRFLASPFSGWVVRAIGAQPSAAWQWAVTLGTTYAPDSTPRDRLIALLHELSIEPGELVLPIADATWRDRLAAYWAARNRFVESGRDVRPSPRVTDMLAQVREPLLSVLRISPDFRPAYDPLLAMAAALARSDASGARTLLGELSRIQPARSEAIRLLAALAGEPPTAEPAAR